MVPSPIAPSSFLITQDSHHHQQQQQQGASCKVSMCAQCAYCRTDGHVLLSGGGVVGSSTWSRCTALHAWGEKGWSVVLALCIHTWHVRMNCIPSLASALGSAPDLSKPGFTVFPSPNHVLLLFSVHAIVFLHDAVTRDLGIFIFFSLHGHSGAPYCLAKISIHH